MEVYVGVVHKDADSDYGVSFPEVPGVATAGTTLDEAAVMAREALAMHIESFDEDGEARPPQRGIEWVRAHPDAADAQCFIVVAAPPRTSAQVRINITIDPALLERIDRAAHAHGSSRSAFLADAARSRLAVKTDAADAVYTLPEPASGHFREEGSRTSGPAKGRKQKPRSRNRGPR